MPVTMIVKTRAALHHPIQGSRRTMADGFAYRCGTGSFSRQ